MKKSFTLICLLLFVFFANAARTNTHLDSAQHTLKIKMDMMEKHIKSLQAEIKTLKSADSIQVLELNAIKQVLPSVKTKKLVIDRRGTKQANFQ